MALHEISDFLGDEVKDARHVSGGDEAKLEIGPWLEQLLKDADNEDDLAVILFHQSRTGEHDIWKSDLHFGDDVGEFVETLMEQAEEDALRNRGRNKYSVRVRGKRGCKRFALLSPELREDEDLETTPDFDDSPTLKGLLAQFMRHNEKMLKIVVTNSRESSETVMRANRDLTREVQEYRQQDSERRAIETKLRNMDFAKEMEIKKYERAEKRREEMMQTVMAVGKQVIAQKLGISILREPEMREALTAPSGGEGGAAAAPAADGAVVLVFDFLQKLTPAQIQALGLSPEQRESFLALYKRLADAAASIKLGTTPAAGPAVEGEVIEFLRKLRPEQFQALSLSDAQQLEFAAVYQKLAEWNERNEKK